MEKSFFGKSLRAGGLIVSLFYFSSSLYAQNKELKQPNIVLILTDDQGFGDMGYHGNPDIATPVIDAFAKENIKFSNFYVSPVCSPTRASLLTGRYNIRTGVFDTLSGGSIMALSETTIAEILSEAGYATGHFGKWHLGSNYPSRPQNQGFKTTAWSPGGGIEQNGDFDNYFRKDSFYFNPVIWRNDVKYQSNGYCTNVWTDEAISFIQKNKTNPLFVYLA